MTNLKLKYLFFYILFFTSFLLQAQYQFNGDAIALSDTCFQLTDAEISNVGSVWSNSQIDLRESFDITFDIYFECNNCEADGITFSLYPSPDGLGQNGGGLGFETLTPSLGVEFDVFHNIGIPLGDLSDPPFDHVSIFSNGIVDHLSPNNLAEPVLLNPENENVKDCEYHEIKVTWDALAQEINVYFNCQLRISYSSNIIDQIFQGEPFVHWGFTASTGQQFCQQIVCVKETKIRERLNDFSMCQGGGIQLNASGGQSYQWSPSESVSNPNIANPIANPEVSTTYSVTITDGCSQFVDTVRIEVISHEVDFGFSDSFLCANDSVLLDATTPNASYSWSTGATTPTITVLTPGYYVVTVTIEDEDCIANDAVQLNPIQLPAILFLEYESICINEIIELDATFPNATYTWQDGSTDSIYLVTESGFYSVLIEHPCESKEFSKEINVESSCTDVYLPSAFSPNFDGINDHFIVLDGGDILNIAFLRILDRWGEVVYEAKNFQPNDRNYGWDGTFKGKPLNNGTYAYILSLTFRNMTSKTITGEINIIR